MNKINVQIDFSANSSEEQGTNISQVGGVFSFIAVHRKAVSHVDLVLQVVYLGLHIVTPLISLDLLKFPKLCHDVSFSFIIKETLQCF